MYVDLQMSQRVQTAVKVMQKSESDIQYLHGKKCELQLLKTLTDQDYEDDDQITLYEEQLKKVTPGS